ncbi:peptide-binding protein [Campylobacter sp. MIT 21-1685]|nr:MULTISPECIES: STT3 domain-containing protein [unclassified Campylobacter]MCX2683207.1 peptide-binding protein [Campylobacter sp. MIT 21-1684]MCX2751473.1 peptide-binding protein [Campylobacter sp. MIT 21-1682]MCX2807688.1 peptide-binding protein [Campylobacter sp. MIT 21-1685]
MLYKFSKNNTLIALILFAFIFSVVCRLYWVIWASQFDEYFFNNELMIISNDGYAFAEGARDMIAGFHQENDLSYYGSSLSTLTYWLSNISSIQFETLILYMSTFFSSLVVIPLLLLANEFKKLSMGFYAALLASIANSYYNRTMTGYYDTDMLVIVFAMMIVFLMIRLLLKKDLLSLLLFPLFVGLYLWWYPSSYSLNVAFLVLFFLYIVLFHRKEKILYMAILFASITLSNIAWFYQSAIITLLFALFTFQKKHFTFVTLSLLGFATFIFLALSGGIDPILYQLQFYVFRSDESANITQGFVYFNVNKTIQEVESISLNIFMQRISGSEIVFIASFIGFLLLVKKHREMIVSLPMIILGFFALKGGLRFTIYAVPLMALGFGYLSLVILAWLQKVQIQNYKQLKNLELSFIGIAFTCLLLPLILALILHDFHHNVQISEEFFQLFFGNALFLSIFIISLSAALCYMFLWKRKYKALSFAFNGAVFIFSLFFSIKHIYEYKAPTVFSHNEASLLTELKNIANREDYVVSWWDYGYPIRYYSDVKTLADGGKHLGKDNFFPSFILSKEQKAAARMARLSVEYTEKSFYTRSNDLLETMMKEYNYKNIELFLNSLSKDNFIINSEKTRDVYLYMPARMSLIFSTVASFSNVDLENGKLKDSFYFTTAFAIANNNGQIQLNNGIILNDDFRNFKVNTDTFSLHSLIELHSIQNSQYKITTIDENAKYYLFYLQDNSIPFVQFILMDKTMFESAFVQMFFLGQYDKNLFELVSNTRDAKVFKLKI